MLNRHVYLALSLIAATLGSPTPLWSEITLDRMELVSRTAFAAGDAQGGRHQGHGQAFSADGRYVTWASTSSAMVAGVADSNGDYDIFLADLEDGTVVLVSHSEGDPLRATGGAIPDPMLSADGRFILFTASRDPGVTGARQQVYLYDRVAATTQRVSHAAGSTAAANGYSYALDLSTDGRYVAFQSTANNLIVGVADGTTSFDVFVWDRLTDSVQLASHRHDDPLTAAQHAGAPAQLSADGRYLAYAADSDDLIANGSSALRQVYLFDRETGANSLVSRTPAGLPGAGEGALAMTPDGRFVLFNTPEDASGMVPGLSDQNVANDLFLFDRTTSAVELISRAAGPTLATGDDDCSSLGAVSDDGLKVYFVSQAKDMVAGVSDGNSTRDLFLRDRQAGATTLISHAANDPLLAATLNFYPVFAAPDGSSAVFSSNAISLVAGLTAAGSGPFVYRYDLGTDQVSLLSHAPGEPSVARNAAPLAMMTPDGQRLLWSTFATGALTGEPDPQPDAADAVVHDRGLGQSILLSKAASPGFEATSASFAASGRMSDDGRWVAFQTNAQSCAPGQPIPAAGGRSCLLDRASGELRLLSHRWDDPEVAISALSTRPLEFSQDGRWLLLSSAEPGMAPVDSNGTCDLFLYDTQESVFELVSDLASQATAAAGLSCQSFEGPPNNHRPLLSGDANRVLFSSQAATLDATATDGNTVMDVYLKDRSSGDTRLLTTSASNPAQAANNESRAHEITADGRYVLLTSLATNLRTGFVDGNGGGADVFLLDLDLGTRALVSRSATSPQQSGNQGVLDRVAMSTSGALVAFTSRASDHLLGTDGGTDSDVFLFQRATGVTTLVSHAQGQPTIAANGDSYLEDISSDGRFVLFLSDATNLAAVTVQQGFLHLYLWDRLDGSVRLVSHRQGQPTQAVDTNWGVLSADGRRVVFPSITSDVTSAPDFNDTSDLFLWDSTPSALSAISLVSRRFEAPARTGSSYSPETLLQIDKAGTRILFSSGSADLVGGSLSSDKDQQGQHDTNQDPDLFLAFLGDALFADGFESGTTGAWSAAQP